MGLRVVCISRTLGAEGEAVGKTLAVRLGFRYIDEEIVTAAAEKARVDPKLIADTEHRQSLLNRLMDSLAVIPQAKTLSAGEMAGNAAATHANPRASHRALIRDAIAEIAARGQVVIVAHAASMMLGGTPDLLRVLITASAVKRAERLRLLDSSLTANRAAAAIADSDRARREYLRDFYSLREELPTHYDLVINTDVLTIERAVTAIVGLAQR